MTEFVDTDTIDSNVSNVFLNRSMVEYFIDQNVLASAFDLRIDGVDSDVMALGDSFKWTYVDRSSLGGGTIVDGKVATWAKPVLKAIFLKIDRHLGLATMIARNQAETTKTVTESLAIDMDQKMKTIEQSVFTALKGSAVAYGGTDLAPTVLAGASVGMMAENTLSTLTDIEAYFETNNIPEANRIIVTAPLVAGRFSMVGQLVPNPAYSAIRGFKGNFNTVAVKSWNGIHATVAGNYPIYFGNSKAIATAVLIDEIIRDDHNVEFPGQILYSGIFDYGVAVVKPAELDELFVTYVRLTVPAGI